MARFPMILTDEAQEELNYLFGEFHYMFGFGQHDGYDDDVEYTVCHDPECSCEGYDPIRCDDPPELRLALIDLTTNENSIDFFTNNPEILHREGLAYNPNANILWNYPAVYGHEWSNPSLIEHLKRAIQRGQKPYSEYIQMNPLAEQLGYRYDGGKVVYDRLYHDFDFTDPMIFTYDYNDIKDTMAPFTSMITGYFYRPVAVARWIESNDFETIGSEEYLVSAAKF